MEQVNLADREQVKRAKEKEKSGKERNLNDLATILNLKEGRRLLWRQLEFCGVYNQSADASGSWTYFNEGKRAVGIMILREIMEVNPDAYILMMKESKE